MKDIYKEEEVFASDAVHYLMDSYAGFVNRALFGHSVDGLIKVQRRIIQVLKNSNKPRDVSGWAADVKPFHPHGESSIESAMARMMQEFKYQLPFINTYGHAGSYKDAKAADQKYLKAAGSDFMKDIFFDTHSAALSYKQNEAEDGSIEVEYLIPKIPMALCLGIEGIGVGFSTNSYPMDINNICNLTVWFIDQMEKGDSDSIIGNKFPLEVCEWLLPHFPIECNIRNKEQLMRNLSVGTYDNRVMVEGNYRLTQNDIIIHTIPWGTDFITKSSQLNDLRKEKNKEYAALIEAIDDVQDIVDGRLRMKYKITFKKKYNSWQFLDVISKLFGLCTAMTPQSRWLMKSNIHELLGPGQLLDIWYRERTRATLIKFSKDQDRHIQTLHRLRGLLVLKDHDEKVLSIIRNSHTTDEYAKLLKEEFGLTYYQAIEIGKVPLDYVRKKSRESILDEIKSVEDILTDIKRNMDDIPNFIKGEVLSIQKKYGTYAPKRTVYPEYRGYIKTPQGYVQVQSLDDTKNRRHFDSIEIRILPPSAYRFRYKRNELGKWDADSPILFPRYFQYTEFDYLPEPAKYTVVLNQIEGNTIFACEGLYGYPEEEHHVKQSIIAGSKITTIDQVGRVKVVDVNTLPIRKTMASQGNKTDVEHILNQAYDQMVIFYTNVNEPNFMRASLIRGGSGKLKMFSEGVTKFFVVPFVDEEVVFLPDVGIFNRIKPVHVHIPSIIKLFGNETFIMFDFSKKQNKRGKDLAVKYLDFNK